MLTRENWKQGFLIDEQWMGGISEEPAGVGQPSAYAAYVVSHASGDYVGYHVFQNLDSALETINKIPRAWKFESSSECGGCGKGACRQSCQTTGTCELES